MDFSLKGKISPEDHARVLIHELKIKEWPVNVKDVAKHLGLEYVEEKLPSEKVDGGLDLTAEPYLLVVNSRISYEGRKNFTGAHELGHFRIPEHRDHQYKCSPFNVAAYDGADKTVEQEANRFAAELLMPRERIRDFLKSRMPGVQTVEAIVENFRVSMTAAAIRMIQVTDEKAAVVLSRNGRILWSVRSRAFGYEIFRRDKPLHEHTYAIDIFSGSEDSMCNCKQVIPFAWLASSGIAEDMILYEHSVNFSDLGMIMTILTVPFEDNDIDNEW